ncbi:LysM peptidoglycan-binding domain-containing protein [Phytoactinopolyspora limicola]|uniref:LysM peptidoglycan-binding domain-containing protein n=1 Tax=Phytoactinopolyspora limicola TaxID=2715536 RepID=UPI001408975D|nr:LysM peptidoglycan-binding domain-containing protein [Phytoactinopolyspora limicola]
MAIITTGAVQAPAAERSARSGVGQREHLDNVVVYPRHRRVAGEREPGGDVMDAGESGAVVAMPRVASARSVDVRRAPAVAPRPVRPRGRVHGCATPAAPTLHGSRLTRRGRLVVAAIWLVLVAAAVVPFVRASGGVDANVQTVPVQVEAGDTLWRVAQEVQPGADPRVLVDAIMEINGLTSVHDIQPGDRLLVPMAAG